MKPPVKVRSRCPEFQTENHRRLIAPVAVSRFFFVGLIVVPSLDGRSIGSNKKPDSELSGFGILD
jgi:hypothetical protein